MSSKSPTTEQPTDGWTNNIDWNNAITGSPVNTIELKIDEVQATQSVTNAVEIVPTDKKEMG
jgi:hypothetical protein